MTVSGQQTTELVPLLQSELETAALDTGSEDTQWHILYCWCREIACCPSVGIQSVLVASPEFSLMRHWKIYHTLSFERVTYTVYLKTFSLLSMPCTKKYPVFLHRISIVPALTQCQSEGNRKHWPWQGVSNQLKPSASCFQVTNPSISVQAAWSLMA